MKNTKKLLFMIPALGLFLTGCSFDDVKSWVGSNVVTPVSNLFNGKKEENKTGDETKKDDSSSQSPQDSDPTTPTVDPSTFNEHWPTADIASFWEKYGITDTVPGYTGESDEITFTVDTTNGYVYVTITVPAGSTEEAVVASYVQDLTNAKYKEYKEIDGDMSYVSPNNQILLLPYCGSSISESGYVFISFGMPQDEGEVSETFPTDKVKEVLEYTGNIPAPTGTSFGFAVDSEYDYSCYVTVHGGDLSAYLTTLENAGFEVYDYLEDEDIGMAGAYLGDLCIEVADPESNSEFVLNYFIDSDE